MTRHRGLGDVHVNIGGLSGIVVANSEKYQSSTLAALMPRVGL
jgi:hypothetical protein